MKNNSLFLIDGSSLLSPYYYGTLPISIKKAKTEEEKEKHYHEITQIKGIYLNAIIGTIRVLIHLLQECEPKYIAVCLDDGRNTFRKKIYSEYKSTRKETPEPLVQQRNTFIQILKACNIPVFSSKNYEADDLIASLKEKFEKELEINIISRDTDFFQLVTPEISDFLGINNYKTTFYFMMQTIGELEVFKDELDENLIIKKEDISVINSIKGIGYNPAMVHYKTNVTPYYIPDMKALSGDSSDNIPGIKGISQLTASRLIEVFGCSEILLHELKTKDISELEKHWKEKGWNRPPYKLLMKNLSETEEKLILSKQLGKMKKDIPITLLLEDFEIIPDNVISSLKKVQEQIKNNLH